MRLMNWERNEIVRTARQYFGERSKVILFGSRVRDDARGGDIDLLIIPNEKMDHLYEKKLRFRTTLKGAIGDQKIDVVLAGHEDERTIVKQALISGEEL